MYISVSYLKLSNLLMRSNSLILILEEMSSTHLSLQVLVNRGWFWNIWCSVWNFFFLNKQ